MTSKLDHVPIIAAWGRVVLGDPAAGAAGLLNDASLLYIPGRSGLAGQYQGREAIVGLLSRLTERTGGMLRFQTTRVVRSEDHAILLGRLHASGKGSEINIEAAHVLEIADGIVQEIWMFHQNQYVLDELWGGGS